MPNYTAPDVNMLHIARHSAGNNKIKGAGVDFSSALRSMGVNPEKLSAAL